MQTEAVLMLRCTLQSPSLFSELVTGVYTKSEQFQHMKQLTLSAKITHQVQDMTKSDFVNVGTMNSACHNFSLWE
jgi:hypothetical protein